MSPLAAAADLGQYQLRKAQAAALNAEFEPCGWHCFISDEGRWWASRVPGPKNLKASCGETIDADTAREMRRILTSRTAA